MDKHEMAMRTYEELKRRKKRKEDLEIQKKMDKTGLGWNGLNRHMTKLQKRYYNKKHTT